MRTLPSVNSCAQAVKSVSQLKEFLKVFIISLCPSMILEVTPNAYFFTMLLHQIIAALSHLHLNGRWMYFLLHNFNVIKSRLTLECYLSVSLPLVFQIKTHLGLVATSSRGQKNTMTSKAYQPLGSGVYIYFFNNKKKHHIKKKQRLNGHCLKKQHFMINPSK